LPFDDRAGVHVTDDWGLALRYAAFKAARASSIAIVLTYDLNGLKLEPDFDAQVAREHEPLRDVAWYIKEFDILTDADSPDYDRLADVLESAAANDDPDYTGNVYSVQDTLTRQSRTPLEQLLAEALRDPMQAEQALEMVKHENAPLELYAAAIHQWRTFAEVADSRLLCVEAVEPFFDEVFFDWEEEATDNGDCPRRFTIEDLDHLADVPERIVLWDRFVPRGTELYYHGTDLTRARRILAEVDVALYNPWAPCVQPQE